MELKTSHIVNRDKKEITFLLYGIIGEKIDGDYFAQELNWAGRNYDIITIRINSDGGDVTQGLSIISEIFASSAHVITKIDGVAASIAGVIAFAGDEIKANDYAQWMCHEAYYIDKSGKRVPNEQLSAKDKKAIKKANEQLAFLLSKRGKSEEEIAKLMKKETWLKADELLADQLIDEVIETGRKSELAALAPQKLVAKLIDENPQITQKTDTNMKLIALALGLPENATEKQIVDAINAEKAKLTSASNKVTTMEKALVDQKIEQGKASGAITDDNEAEMRELATANAGLFDKVVKKMVAKTTTDDEQDGNQNNLQTEKPLRMSDVLNVLKNQTGGGSSSKTEAEQFDDLQKNDPDALEEMETKEPEKFKKLYDAYEKSLR